MANEVRSHTTAATDTPHAANVLDELGLGTVPTRKRYVPGRMEMLRLLRERSSTITRATGAFAELVFDARPASGHGHVHFVHIRFCADGEVPPPAALEPAQRRLTLYYAASELDRLRSLLRSGKDRLCYFWQGASPERVHAWLFTSP